MLSGSRPRGRSSTPASGKIGSVAGRSGISVGMPVPPIAPRWLREEQGGEAPPCAEGERIGRAHDLEELDELLARALLVPAAGALDDLEQLLDRRLALARGEKCRGEVEACLVVLRV